MKVQEGERVEAAASVYDWRLDQAEKAHLTTMMCKRFAAGDGDVELLRTLAKKGVDPKLIARIVT